MEGDQEKILIRSEADPPLLSFSKIYSLLGESIDVKCRQRLFRSLVYRYYWTSQYCRKCNRKGIRKIQRLFRCRNCNVRSENADRNAAFNIAYRGLGQVSSLGVTVNIPRTFPSVDRNAMMRKEATDFNQW